MTAAPNVTLEHCGEPLAAVVHDPILRNEPDLIDVAAAAARDPGGLAVALGALAGKAPVPVTVDAPIDRLGPEIEATAYFVASEALTNVAKHARASSAAITAFCEDGKLVIEVADNGVGGAAADGGTGLRGLADRVEAQGGRLVVESSPGGGTRVIPEGFGYLLKDRVLEIDDFLEAVGRVGRGGTAIDPQVIALLLGRAREDDPLGELTPREREVLGLMAEGLSNKGICRRLFLSPKTVETHVNSIFLKLRLMPAPDDHRRVLAVLAFLKS